MGQFINVGTVNGTTYTNPDSLTVTASCFVDTWYDQAGSNDAEQATHGSQPQIHDGTADTDLITENGKPALDFQNDVVYTSGNITLTDGGWLSLAVATTNGGQDNVINSSDGSPRVAQFVRTSAGNSIQSVGFTSTGAVRQVTGPNVGVDTQFLGIGQAANPGLTAYANGTAGGTNSTFVNTTDSAPFYVGARNTSGDMHNGYIQEVIHWPTDRSGNRTDIETTLTKSTSSTNPPTPPRQDSLPHIQEQRPRTQ